MGDCKGCYSGACGCVREGHVSEEFKASLGEFLVKNDEVLRRLAGGPEEPS